MAVTRIRRWDLVARAVDGATCRQCGKSFPSMLSRRVHQAHHTRRSAAEAFWAYVDLQGPCECWPWRGAIRSDGYGRYRDSNAHRAAYLLLRGPVPAGLVLDHLCRNRACVNPDHLEPVSDVVNIRRGERATKPRCIRGHPFAGDNLVVRPNGWRKCRECNRTFWRAYKARKRAAA